MYVSNNLKTLLVVIEMFCFALALEECPAVIIAFIDRLSIRIECCSEKVTNFTVIFLS